MNKWLTLFYWILFLFTAYILFEVLRKIFGGSLGFEELVVGLLIANLGYSFYLNALLSEHLGWHKAERKQEKKLF